MSRASRASHRYSFDEFVDLLLFSEDNFDEGFPGPGFYTREELVGLAITAIDDLINFHCAVCGENTNTLNEYYMVNHELWDRYGVPAGMLCIGCLEARLGRELDRCDFTDAPINEIFDQSERLRARLVSAGP